MGPGIGVLYGSRTTQNELDVGLRSTASGGRKRIVSIAALPAAGLACPFHPPHRGSLASTMSHLIDRASRQVTRIQASLKIEMPRRRDRDATASGRPSGLLTRQYSQGC
jgi:hypothetical protein